MPVTTLNLATLPGHTVAAGRVLSLTSAWRKLR